MDFIRNGVNGVTRVDSRSRTAVASVGKSMSNAHRNRVYGTWANIRKQVKRAAKVGVDEFVRVIDTSGKGMPYKADPTTDARVDTGRMRKGVGSKITRDTQDQFAVRVGWNGDYAKYFAYQDEGTKKLRAMKAKAQAAAVIRQEINRRLK